MAAIRWRRDHLSSTGAKCVDCTQGNWSTHNHRSTNQRSNATKPWQAWIEGSGSVTKPFEDHILSTIRNSHHRELKVTTRDSLAKIALNLGARSTVSGSKPTKKSEESLHQHCLNITIIGGIRLGDKFIALRQLRRTGLPPISKNDKEAPLQQYPPTLAYVSWDINDPLGLPNGREKVGHIQQRLTRTWILKTIRRGGSWCSRSNNNT